MSLIRISENSSQSDAKLNNRHLTDFDASIAWCKSAYQCIAVSEILPYFRRKFFSWSTSHCFSRSQRHPTLLIDIGPTIRHEQLTRIYGYRGMIRTIYVMIMVKRWHDHRMAIIFRASSQNPHFPLTLPLQKTTPKHKKYIL